MHYDLHCHSTFSDGLLTPTQLIHRAASRGVDVLALTDHDDTGGLEEAIEAARDTAMQLVPSAELSVSRDSLTLHVVALRIDHKSEAFQEGLASIRGGRGNRAKQMARSLEQAGVPDSYLGAMKYVTSERLISRTHFARYLVEAGFARDTKDAFSRFLTPGKPGYVEHEWATLPHAIDLIHRAGGQAILAHPGRYKLTTTEMRALLAEFRDLGGDGIEVLSSSHTHAQYAEYARYARVFGFLASCGSDYHGPGESHLDLGDLPPLPAGVVPVWTAWH